MTMFRLKALLIATLVCMAPSLSHAESDRFTVLLNDLPHTKSGNVRPCYPVFAKFEHPNPKVTRIRMRYPYNHDMYKFFDVNLETNLQLHEDYMKQGKVSLSDFIAEDYDGNSYGQMTLTFIPVDPANGELCDAYLNS